MQARMHRILRKECQITILSDNHRQDAGYNALSAERALVGGRYMQSLARMARRTACFHFAFGQFGCVPRWQASGSEQGGS